VAIATFANLLRDFDTPRCAWLLNHRGYTPKDTDTHA